VFALLLLLPLTALGEGEGLFPAMGDKELWGYINRQGEFVVDAQYELATPFCHGYAAVTCGDELWGIIDETGNYIFPMDYVISMEEDSRIFIVITGEAEDMDPSYAILTGDQLAGFFCPETGVFSGFQWKSVEHVWDDSTMVSVLGENHLYGFADLETGRQVIPCQFQRVYGFHQGWALAELPAEAEEDAEMVLINETGDILRAPEGYYFEPYDSRMSEGLVAVYDEAYIASYMNMDGEVVISTDYEGIAYPFYEGFAALNDQQYRDRQGNILKDIIARPEEIGGYEFVDGLTSVFYQGKPAAMNTNGEIKFVLEEENVFWLWNFMENGLAWYMEWQEDQGDAWYEQKHYGLVAREGNYITDGVWICTMEEGSPFSEGLAPVKPMEGPNLYGYLNEQGELALPAVYEEAQPFKNGLAYVVQDGKCGYIDKQGDVIYSWPQYEENWD